MAENKRITLDWDTSGLTVYCIIRRETDDFRMNDADGSFAVSPADPYVGMAEDAVIKGRYELDESRTVWDDGRYSVAIYNQAGGSPAPASDTIIGTGEMAIKDDLEVFLDIFIPTVAEIWANATRTLTSFGTLVNDIWTNGTRTLTTFGTLVADIWANVSRTLTDKTGFEISGTKTKLDDLNDLSLGDIQGEIQSGVLAKRITVTGDPFSIVEKTTKTLQIDLGAEWDLTNKLVYFVMARRNSSDAPIVNRLVDTITDAVNGLAEIDLLTTETTPKGCYDYQVELRNDPADDEPETAMEGTAEVTENLRL
ncbi:hypothetical protein KAR91_70380 [Candidatus Pacearchaeota archaeon]|nr:hypothetical protein [Candidatus Pacearchaeota archaeon]